MDDENGQNDEHFDGDNCGQHVDERPGATAQDNLERHVAKFMLCAREKGRVSQTALDMVKDSTKNLLNEYFDTVKKALVEKIKGEVGQEFEFTQDMDELFEVDKVFERLDTEHQQRSYYLNNFNLVVSSYFLTHSFIFML